MQTSIVRLAAAAVVLCGLAFGAAAPARAQGMYYKEIRKDERIYVFNSAATADAFEKSGEMGVGITRPGVGPNGETVVADSERALELFFFKYGISEPVKQPPPPPPPAPPWRISGYIFGDYYYFAQHHLDGTSPDWEGQHGFWIRRAYLTYDHNLSPKITTRLRLEMNSNGKLAGGNLTPYVKDAYLRWTYFGRQQVYLGIWGTATFNFIENVWGLRHIEKTPVDLYRLDGSRDFGLSFEGPVLVPGLVYTAQYGNNSGNGSETDKYKAYRFAARYDINPGIVLEGFYGAYEKARQQDETILQGFGGYRSKVFRAGLQYTRKEANSGTAAPDKETDLVSAFGVFDIVPRKATVFGRWDRVDGNNVLASETGVAGVDGIDYLPIDPRFDFNFVLAGLEYYIHPSFRVSPNFEWVNYGDGPSNAAGPIEIDDDMVLRLTFYWTW
jgi:hypothetical protein